MIISTLVGGLVLLALLFEYYHIFKDIPLSKISQVSLATKASIPLELYIHHTIPELIGRVDGDCTLIADMQDNQSVAVLDPTERVVKAILYIHDCEPHGGANGAVVGTHRLPWSIGEVYGKQFYNGNEVRLLAKARLLESPRFQRACVRSSAV